ncbi:MAG: type I glyceraldehyde-3-phosphate dehydrogenase [Planctomycetota bacterium]|jgi:glyceraldehyde 3-phosphate dehydrogenase
MAIRIGINGFGRIGRNIFRIMHGSDDFDIVAVNDLGDAKTMAHLLKYDSVFRQFPGEIVVEGEELLIVDGREVKMLTERDPSKLPWGDLGVDFVVEATGVFRLCDQLQNHCKAGAPKVLLTVPAKDKIDATIVLKVNCSTLKPEHKIISNASCTTNCLAPVAKVLHDNFGIVNGLMTTIHAYTNDQRLLDFPHKDLRRARAAAVNMIPTTTGAARAVGVVIPDLNGKLNGMAIRVPTPDASLVDLVVNLEKGTTVEAINSAMREEAEGHMKGVLEYTEDPIVSGDVIGNPHSSIFDAPSTMAMGGNFFKVLSWYDNEWGYSSRVCDVIKLAHGLG